MAWQRVASVEDVQPGRPCALTIGNKALALYRLNDKIYALDDVCPHAYALLSSGFVDGDEVECPLHQAVFHIPTGKCLAPPADRDLATYPVKLEGNNVFVNLDDQSVLSEGAPRDIDS